MTRFLSIALALAAAPTFANNHFFVLSGGDTPAGNHLSQYYQTRTLTNGLRDLFGRNAVDVMFAAGHRPDARAAFADVHGIDSATREQKLVVGSIEGNRAATKPNVVDYFARTVSHLAPSDTFFLLVSDHGMPNRDIEDPDHNDNCINLWRYRPRAGGFDRGNFADACLSRSDLESLIRTHVRARRTVFGMSQCFSGGFHKMSVKIADGYPTANTNVCGFTAITDDSVASGCTPDADGPNYKGYERYFTQRITGRDVVTGQPIPGGARSTLREAHLMAALDDMTLDIPTSTSDHYLSRWADTIDGEDFQPRTSTMTAAQVRRLFADSAASTADDEALAAQAGPLGNVVRQRRGYLRRMAQAIALQDAALEGAEMMSDIALAAWVDELDGTLSDIESKFESIQTSRYDITLYTISDQWSEAVRSGHVALSPELKALELEYFIPVSLDEYNEDFGNYAVNLAAADSLRRPVFASELMNYVANRNRIRLEWAWTSGDAELTEQARRLRILNVEESQLAERYDHAQLQRGYLRRLLLQKRQLGATVALGAMGDTRAMAELNGLMNCEASPF